MTFNVFIYCLTALWIVSVASLFCLCIWWMRHYKQLVDLHHVESTRWMTNAQQETEMWRTFLKSTDAGVYIGARADVMNGPSPQAIHIDDLDPFQKSEPFIGHQMTEVQFDALELGDTK